MAKLVSIVIVNFNGKELLKNCLVSIRTGTAYSNYEIIVVDNGSTDGSCEMIRDLFPEVKLVSNKSNLGFATATNQGMKVARGDYIFLLNNDTLVPEGWLSELVRIAEGDKKIGVVGCSVVDPRFPDNPYGPIFFKPYGDRLKFLKPRFFDYNWYPYETGYDYRRLFGSTIACEGVVGAAMLINRQVVEKVGLLDEGYSPAHAEDYDFCVRVKLAGYKIVASTSVTITHIGGQTGIKFCDEINYFNRKKNYIRFALINFPSNWLFVSIPHALHGLYRSILAGRFKLLITAYAHNIHNLKDILSKRRVRAKLFASGRRLFPTDD